MIEFENQLYGAWRSVGLVAAPSKLSGGLAFACPACDTGKLEVADQLVSCDACDFGADGEAWEVAAKGKAAVKVAPKERKAGDWPGVITLPEFAGMNPQPTPELIKGVLNQGCKMMVAGPSKARKSWILIDLAISCGIGRQWMGLETEPCRTLFINFELHPWMLWGRIQKVLESRGWLPHFGKDKNLAKSVGWLNLRGLTTDLVAMAERLKEAAQGYELIIIDPIYKALGERDENSAGDIAGLCNCIEDVCGATGAAVVFAHHYAKGISSDKAALDRMSGSGVWARDPDALIMLTPPRPPKPARGKEPEEPGYDLDMEFVLRAHAPLAAKRLKWLGGHFSDDDGPRYVLKHKNGSYAERFGDLIRGLPPLTRAEAEEWLKMAADISIDEAQKAFHALKREEYGFLEFDNLTKKWKGAEDPFAP
jgi:hypothetical protein